MDKKKKPEIEDPCEVCGGTGEVAVPWTAVNQGYGKCQECDGSGTTDL